MEHCSVPIPQEVGMVQMTAAQVGHKIAILNLEEAFQANGIITITPLHDTLNLAIARHNQSLPIYLSHPHFHIPVLLNTHIIIITLIMMKSWTTTIVHTVVFCTLLGTFYYLVSSSYGHIETKPLTHGVTHK